MAEAMNLRRRDLRDRGVEQAILSLKKGAYLLKCGKRGKPKFCPFRLSTDEKLLYWYVGEGEKQLKLNTITRITRGQQTVNFLRHQLYEKESQSFSLIYQNGEKSLDLICKDKEQAELWLLALSSLVEISHYRPLPTNLRSIRGSNTCSNSPVSHSCMKQKVGYLDHSARFPRAHSLSASPQSLLQRHFSVTPYSHDHHYCSTPKPLSSLRTILEGNLPHLPQMAYRNFKEKMNPKVLYNGCQKDSTAKIKFPLSTSSPARDGYILKDLFLWGEGTGGILGGGFDGSKSSTLSSDYLLPKLLEPTGTLDIHSISCGRSHASMVTKHGEIFTWGKEKGGRLGHKIDMDMSGPKVVESLRDIIVDATCCGAYHTCALASSGELYLWGSGCQTGGASRGVNRNPWLPHKISGSLEGIHISRIACGEWHTAVITSSGLLFTFGDGTFGALGHGDLQSTDQPRQVSSLKGLRVKSVACGPWHTAAIVEVTSGCRRCNTLGGKLFTWGDNDKGQLGHVDKHKKLVPTCVSSILDYDFVQVSCGDMLTVVLSVSGVVITMGSSENGQLGNPLAADKSIAVVECNLRSKHVKKISCGSAHVVILTTNNEVYSWGKGANGRLGLGDIEDRNSPTIVEALKDMHVENIACGSAFTAAVCLHKTTSGFNQTACSGCKMVFTFTRKKHNCYNCGFAFCSLCTGKKAMNASLAPSRTRQFRVCNPCYTQLSKCMNASLKSEIQTPRALSWARRFFDLKIDGKITLAKAPQVPPCANECEELKFLARQPSFKVLSNQGCHEVLPVGSDACSKAQRWGEVSCPSRFITWHGDNPRISFSIPSDEVTNFCNVHDVHKIKLSRSAETTPVKARTCKIEKVASVADEIERLQAEVKNLTEKCQVKSEKLLLYKQKIDETWSVARDEAAKCKAAKEIVKALTCQINAVASKFSSGKEVKLKSLLREKLEFHSPQIIPLPVVPKNADSLIKINDQSSHNHSAKHGNVNMDEKSFRPSDASSRENIIEGMSLCPSFQKEQKEEFVEQDEPGIYITFIRMPNGKKGLRRLRFSRKHFTEAQARKWWEENERRIHHSYCIEQPVNPPISKRFS